MGLIAPPLGSTGYEQHPEERKEKHKNNVYLSQVSHQLCAACPSQSKSKASYKSPQLPSISYEGTFQIKTPYHCTKFPEAKDLPFCYRPSTAVPTAQLNYSILREPVILCSKH